MNLLGLALRLLPLRGRKWLMGKLAKDTRVVVNCGEEDEMEVTLDVFLENYEVLD